MFLKGGYFGELTPLAPRNIININPGVVLSPTPRMQVELNVAAFWRASRTDGIYDMAGRELRGAGTVRARHIGNVVEASCALDLASRVSLAASLGAFTGGAFMRQGGKADTIFMLGAEATYRFQA